LVGMYHAEAVRQAMGGKTFIEVKFHRAAFCRTVWMTFRASSSACASSGASA
jgi:hypothetical protein